MLPSGIPTSIRVKLTGNLLQLYVNQELVSELTLGFTKIESGMLAILAGDVSIAAGAEPSPSWEACFDYVTFRPN